MQESCSVRIMKKTERLVQVYLQSLQEYALEEKEIESLPRGYISVKVISGHTYYYRQWREGSKIISDYVPEGYLNIVKQKIAIRKEHEQLLKILKKDLKKAERACLKNNLLTEEQIEEYKQKASKGEPLE